jgi:hypothetical protein
MSACLCHPCGREFTGLTAFDRHQDVDYTRRPAVRCMDPASVGLVQGAHGRWGFPSDAASRARFGQMAAQRASAGMTGSPPPGSEPAEPGFAP